MQTFFKEDIKKMRKRKKPMSKQRLRSTWINLCLCLWGMIIVKRDNRCQWCKGAKCGNARLGAHHIVARSLTLGDKLAWFDENNGMALGWFCHNNIKHQPDEYILFRDKWLSDRDMSYEGLRLTYSTINKLPKDKIELNFNILRAKCEGMQIPYSENKTYQRLIRKLGNSRIIDKR